MSAKREARSYERGARASDHTRPENQANDFEKVYHLTALPSTLPLILSKQGVLTIHIGSPEILPEKLNGSRHGLGFEEMQFLYSFKSVQLI